MYSVQNSPTARVPTASARCSGPEFVAHEQGCLAEQPNQPGQAEPVTQVDRRGAHAGSDCLDENRVFPLARQNHLQTPRGDPVCYGGVLFR